MLDDLLEHVGLVRSSVDGYPVVVALGHRPTWVVLLLHHALYYGAPVRVLRRRHVGSLHNPFDTEALELTLLRLADRFPGDSHTSPPLSWPQKGKRALPHRFLFPETMLASASFQYQAFRATLGRIRCEAGSSRSGAPGSEEGGDRRGTEDPQAPGPAELDRIRAECYFDSVRPCCAVWSQPIRRILGERGATDEPFSTTVGSRPAIT
jgi:hypothetical protein